MKRRNFLGFLGGAAAAGPKLAQEVAVSVAQGASLSGAYGMPSVGLGSVGPADGDYRLMRIAKLKDLLSGKNSEAAQQRRMQRLYQAESIERMRLDSLRSVSATRKIQMLVEGNMDRSERIEKLHAEQELESLLGQFNPFSQ